jgi:flavin-dependent dehydrogenase
MIMPTDLVIIGAGPAGLSTALHLIQDDPSWAERMILLEKESHPRPKLCGGGITRSGLQTLHELGFPLPLPIKQSRVNNIYLEYKDRVIHVRGEPMFVVVDRPEFDLYLAKQALSQGINIHENEPVHSCIWEDDQVIVNSSNRTYRAKVIVCADGSSGAISGLVRGKKTKKRKGRTLEFWSPAESTSPRFSQKSALFDFNFLSENLQGYYWEFPSIINDHLGHNRGIYDAQLVKYPSQIKLTNILDRVCEQSYQGEIHNKIKSAPIRWFNPSDQISAPRTILVGDAAGADVLFGEGISPALGYGRIAAETIIKAFHDNDFRFATYNRNVLVSKLGRYLLIRRILASYTYHLGHRNFLVHLLWTAGQFLATIWRGKPLF